MRRDVRVRVRPSPNPPTANPGGWPWIAGGAAAVGALGGVALWCRPRTGDVTETEEDLALAKVTTKGRVDYLGCWKRKPYRATLEVRREGRLGLMADSEEILTDDFRTREQAEAFLTEKREDVSVFLLDAHSGLGGSSEDALNRAVARAVAQAANPNTRPPTGVPYGPRTEPWRWGGVGVNAPPYYPCLSPELSPQRSAGPPEAPVNYAPNPHTTLMDAYAARSPWRKLNSAMARREAAMPGSAQFPQGTRGFMRNPGVWPGMTHTQQKAFPGGPIVPGEEGTQQTAFPMPQGQTRAQPMVFQNPNVIGTGPYSNPAQNPYPGVEFSGYQRNVHQNPFPGAEAASYQRNLFQNPGAWPGMTDTQQTAFPQGGNVIGTGPYSNPAQNPYPGVEFSGYQRNVHQNPGAANPAANPVANPPRMIWSGPYSRPTHPTPEDLMHGCPPGTQWDPKTGVCVAGKKCTKKCDTGYILNKTTCKCEPRTIKPIVGEDPISGRASAAGWSRGPQATPNCDAKAATCPSGAAKWSITQNRCICTKAEGAITPRPTGGGGRVPLGVQRASRWSGFRRRNVGNASAMGNPQVKVYRF